MKALERPCLHHRMELRGHKGFREVRAGQQDNPVAIVDGYRDVLKMKTIPFTVKGDLRIEVLKQVKQKAVTGAVAREIQRRQRKVQSVRCP